MMDLSEVFDLLEQIRTDPVVSKSVKLIAEEVICLLKDDCAFELKRDKAIQLLSSTDSPNLCSFTRSMIYELMARLES